MRCALSRRDETGQNPNKIGRSSLAHDENSDCFYLQTTEIPVQNADAGQHQAGRPHHPKHGGAHAAMQLRCSPAITKDLGVA